MRAASLALAALIALSVTSNGNALEATQLHLTEQATREVASDIYVASLDARGESDAADAAQIAVNELMAAAVDRAEAVESVTATTLAYQVIAPRPTDEQRAWVAIQSLRLETTERDALVSLVGDLQGLGLAVRHLGTQLSATAAREVRDELTLEALATLGERAAMTAATLGLRHDGWIAITVDGARPMPRPVLADAATFESARAAPPVMTEGVTQVRVAVTATARLVP